MVLHLTLIHLWRRTLPCISGKDRHASSSTSVASDFSTILGLTRLTSCEKFTHHSLTPLSPPSRLTSMPADCERARGTRSHTYREPLALVSLRVEDHDSFVNSHLSRNYTRSKAPLQRAGRRVKGSKEEIGDGSQEEIGSIVAERGKWGKDIGT